MKSLFKLVIGIFLFYTLAKTFLDWDCKNVQHKLLTDQSILKE